MNSEDIIGFEVITNLFTFHKNKLRVLLIKRDYEPFKGYWMLPTKLISANETIFDCALNRLEKVIGFNDINLKQCNIFSDIDRNPNNRVIAVSLIGLVDIETLFNKRKYTGYELGWFPIGELPKMVYDHNLIVNDAIDNLKKYLDDANFIKNILPFEFAISEYQKLNEEVLKIKLDRRNFRKKAINLLENSGIKNSGKNGRPAELYRFKENNYE